MVVFTEKEFYEKFIPLTCLLYDSELFKKNTPLFLDKVIIGQWNLTAYKGWLSKGEWEEVSDNTRLLAFTLEGNISSTSLRYSYEENGAYSVRNFPRYIDIDYINGGLL